MVIHYKASWTQQVTIEVAATLVVKEVTGLKTTLHEEGVLVTLNLGL